MNDAPPEVSVIVVSHDTAALTDRCLESLQAAASTTSIEVIVVDNASTDGSASWLAARHPQVRVVANPVNVGFARAVNQAARSAAAPLLLLLNPDTEATPGSIDAFVAFARAHPHHGIYGGRTLDPDGRLDPRSCWGRQSLWSLLCFATLLDVAGRGTRLFDPESLGRWQRDTVREVGVVTGCLLLADAGVWEQLGGFDERFFMYGEDADLSLRARRAGWRPVTTPSVTVMHRGGGTPIDPARKTIWKLRARATILRRRWGPVAGTTGLGLLTVGVGARAALARLAPVGATRQVWRDAWAQRRRWRDGYPAAPTGPADLTAEPNRRLDVP